MVDREKTLSKLNKLKWCDWAAFWCDHNSFVDYLTNEVGLVEMPCAVGDKVFFVESKDLMHYEVKSAIVEKKTAKQNYKMVTLLEFMTRKTAPRPCI